MLMRHVHPKLQFTHMLPYGAILHENGVQFVVYSKSATAMRLLLYERVDDAEPEARIRSEAEEEIGYRLGTIRKIFEAFTSPGAVTEKLYFFVAEYRPDMKIGNGGVLAHEGEDIETLELPFTEAFAMIADGRIRDAKTIMLLQYAALNIFPNRY